MLSLLSVVGVEAQDFHSYNFLQPITSLVVSNTCGYTNLQSSASAPGTGFYTTNVNGLIYTNLSSSQVVVGTNDKASLTVDVPMWVDRNGNPIVEASNYTNGIWLGAISGLSVNLHILTAGTGANSAVNVVFSPVCDSKNESTTAGDYWAVGITANGVAPVDLITNIPVWRWPGCKSLRIRTITDSDTDAASQVVFDSITLNGFKP